MIKTLPTGAARVAGVVGQPIRNSLSPVLHNAWLREMQLNGVYAPFAPVDEHAFERLILSCRSNGISGLNITAPFKEIALRLADTVSDTARYAGSANLLTFDADGYVHADSTDGHGLIRAFEIAAPNCDLSAGPVAIMGAGGAAKAAVAALLTKGCPLVRVINRTRARAEELVFAFGERVEACELSACDSALSDCVAVINAASGGPHPLFETMPDHAAVMDMTYRPLKTAWLQAAEARGLQIVDGLHMLIEQARPSFAAFYGVEPFPGFNARALIMSRIEGEAW